MKTVEEIKARYWFLKGKNPGLKYARSYSENSFIEEIEELEHQIMVLKWVVEDSKDVGNNKL